MTAMLTWRFGPMDCGKSVHALQLDHSHRRAGRHGLLFTRNDRSGQPQITTRLGLTQPAFEVTDELNLRDFIIAIHMLKSVDYVICDEAQFYSPEHVDQLSEVVDELRVDVDCFGLYADFQTELFPGAARLFALADRHIPLAIPAMCWCGNPGRVNARIQNGQVIREGDQVVVGDTAGSDVGYKVLCRTHWRRGQATPDAVVTEVHVPRPALAAVA